jgi:hypothetical protein
MATARNTTSATVIAGPANNRRCMRSTQKAEICFLRKRSSGPAPRGRFAGLARPGAGCVVRRNFGMGGRHGGGD